QVKIPFVELIAAPAGAFVAKLNTKPPTELFDIAARFVTTSVCPSTTNASGIGGNDRASAFSSTTTAKLCVALRLGKPSSLTRTINKFVLLPSVWLGVQFSTPFVGLIAASGGALVSRLNVSALAGMSESVAVWVIVSVWPAVIVRPAIAASTGAVLLSSTTTIKLCVA